MTTRYAAICRLLALATLLGLAGCDKLHAYYVQQITANEPNVMLQPDFRIIVDGHIVPVSGVTPCAAHDCARIVLYKDLNWVTVQVMMPTVGNKRSPTTEVWQVERHNDIDHMSRTGGITLRRPNGSAVVPATM